MGPEVLAVVYRGDFEESLHYGSVVVVDNRGKILYKKGNPDRMTFLRSAAKPFQVLPLFESGAYHRYNFDSEDIAVMCGSHSGEDIHYNQVKSILHKIGLAEDYLQCGVHPPFHKPTAQRLENSNESNSTLRNACSGKHACMLAITGFKNWDLNTYMEINHPVQQLMLQVVADITEYPKSQIRTGTDTCGVPVFAVPLKNMALGYANLASEKKFKGPKKEAILQIQKAMKSNPQMIAGTKRFTTDLLQVAGSMLIAKDGAESSFGIGHLPEGIGIAIKVEDGSDRALAAIVLKVLEELGLLENNMLEQLCKYKVRTIKTWGGLDVGRIEAVNIFK